MIRARRIRQCEMKTAPEVVVSGTVLIQEKSLIPYHPLVAGSGGLREVGMADGATLFASYEATLFEGIARFVTVITDCVFSRRGIGCKIIVDKFCVEQFHGFFAISAQRRAQFSPRLGSLALTWATRHQLVTQTWQGSTPAMLGGICTLDVGGRYSGSKLPACQVMSSLMISAPAVVIRPIAAKAPFSAQQRVPAPAEPQFIIFLGMFLYGLAAVLTALSSHGISARYPMRAVKVAWAQPLPVPPTGLLPALKPL